MASEVVLWLWEKSRGCNAAICEAVFLGHVGRGYALPFHREESHFGLAGYFYVHRISCVVYIPYTDRTHKEFCRTVAVISPILPFIQSTKWREGLSRYP